MHRILNIAHRGFSSIYPENTMLAFKKAVEAGCDGVECDIQLTRDNVAVICHDSKINRTTDGGGYIRSYTYRELRGFDAGIRKNRMFKGQRIPSLDEFLEYFSGKDMIVNVELKGGPMDCRGIEEMLIERAYRYRLEKHMIISSFDRRSIERCSEEDGRIKTGLLYSRDISEPERYASSIGAMALHPYFKMIDRRIVKRAHDRGIIVNAWTVNKLNNMKRMIELGIDGIITNCPDTLRSIIE